MAVYLIACDTETDEHYSQLDHAIKELGQYWHYMRSAWIVSSEDTAEEICEALKPLIDDHEILLVVQIPKEGTDSHCSIEDEEIKEDFEKVLTLA